MSFEENSLKFLLNGRIAPNGVTPLVLGKHSPYRASSLGKAMTARLPRRRAEWFAESSFKMKTYQDFV